MVDLFGRDRTVITKHISNIFKENELVEKGNVHFLHKYLQSMDSNLNCLLKQ